MARPRDVRVNIHPGAIIAYHFIRAYIDMNGKFPTCHTIGMALGGSPNYLSTRNRGIRAVQVLTREGFVTGAGWHRSLTDKDLSTLFEEKGE